MKGNVSIIYVQTPFHWRVAKRIIFTPDAENINWLIVCNPLMSSLLKEEAAEFQIVSTENLELKFSWNLFGHLINRGRLLKSIREEKKKWEGFTQLNHIQKIFFFSEKNVFIQMLMNLIDANTEVWCVDEGTALYVEEKTLDWVFKWAYRIVTPLLLGCRYEFFRAHGTHSRINRWLVRLPFCFPNKGNEKAVVGFQEYGIAEVQSIPKFVTRPMKMLILFSPFSEDKRKSIQKEGEMLHNLVAFLSRHHWQIVIKPHPREKNFEKYSMIKNVDCVKILSEKSSSEVLDYRDFGAVIHFYSSSVIDLLESGFPASWIITLEAGYHLDIPSIFGKTHELKLGDWKQMEILLNE